MRFFFLQNLCKKFYLKVRKNVKYSYLNNYFYIRIYLFFLLKCCKKIKLINTKNVFCLTFYAKGQNFLVKHQSFSFNIHSGFSHVINLPYDNISIYVEEVYDDILELNSFRIYSLNFYKLKRLACILRVLFSPKHFFFNGLYYDFEIFNLFLKSFK